MIDPLQVCTIREKRSSEVQSTSFDLCFRTANLGLRSLGGAVRFGRRENRGSSVQYTLKVAVKLGALCTFKLFGVMTWGTSLLLGLEVFKASNPSTATQDLRLLQSQRSRHFT